jgi:membrane-associated phospholipid phosphatase
LYEKFGESFKKSIPNVRIYRGDFLKHIPYSPLWSPTMSIKRRIAYFFIIVACQAIYLPLNRFLSSGVVIKLPVDDLIPIQPIWAIPYMLWMVSWFGLWFWAALRMPEKLYRQLFVTALVVILSAMIFFFVYPTYVPRKPVDATALGAVFLQSVYSADGLYCAFPSGHIYLCTLTAIFFSRWHPRSTWFWVAILIIVSLSTLLTGQHFIMDIFGGLIFAFLGVIIGKRLTSGKSISQKLSHF